MSDTGESWVLRYTATTLGFPDWREAEPARLALVTNHEGSSQAWAHDLASGSWRQLSDEPIGVESSGCSPTGAWGGGGLTGSERGRLVAVPFEGGAPEPVFPDVPDGWLMGLSFEAGRAALGVEVDGDVPRLRDRRRRHHAAAVARRGRRSGSARMRPTRGGLQRRRLAPVHAGTRTTATSCTSRCASSTPRPARRSASCRTAAGTWSPTPGRRCRETGGSCSRASSATSSGPRSGISPPASGATSPSTCRAGSSRSQWWPDAAALLGPARARGPRPVGEARCRDRRDDGADRPRRRHRGRRARSGPTATCGST